MERSAITTTLAPQGRLPSVPHYPDMARRARERRGVQRKEGRKEARAQRGVHGQSKTICVSSALSSPVLVACSSRETSATTVQSILPVRKMPLLVLTVACLPACVDSFCLRATAPPRAPNDMTATVLPDYKASVETLALTHGSRLHRMS